MARPITIIITPRTRISGSCQRTSQYPIVPNAAP